MDVTNRPLNRRIMLRWWSSNSCTIFSAGSIFQSHSAPTGLVWCLVESHRERQPESERERAIERERERDVNGE